jgi:hypothetical protein
MTSQQCNIQWQPYILPAVVVIIGFIIFVLIIIYIKRVCCKRQKWSDVNLASYGEKWKRIEYLSKKEDTRPLAIIYACNLLDQTLKTRGYSGGTLGERLVVARVTLKNNDVSNILQLYNEVAHDTDMKPLKKKKTIQNLKMIRKALSHLNVSV